MPKAIILTADKFEVGIAAPRRGIQGEHGYGLEVKRTFDDVNLKDKGQWPSMTALGVPVGLPWPDEFPRERHNNPSTSGSSVE